AAPRQVPSHSFQESAVQVQLVRRTIVIDLIPSVARGFAALYRKAPGRTKLRERVIVGWKAALEREMNRQNELCQNELLRQQCSFSISVPSIAFRKRRRRKVAGSNVFYCPDFRPDWHALSFRQRAKRTTRQGG